MQVSKDHPRYRSLVVREHMAEMMRQGVVAETGLIAHGRGEAFDYLLGEKTTLEGERAEEVAVALLLEASRPVVTINGNAAALAARDLCALADLVGAKVEVNLFHRSEERIAKVIAYVESQCGHAVLGREQDFTLEGIASDRARCCSQGIAAADVVLIPLEDGDRAEALRKAGKKVIAIDLNPLSRTTLAADIAIVDELTRAARNMVALAEVMVDHPPQERARMVAMFNNQRNLGAVMERMSNDLHGKAHGH
ncbi:MAG: phosphopantothenate/pantothenate synthetase [Methanomassiliicoccales archaeon]